MNSSENTQEKKLLVISCKNTELYLNVTENSEIVKNPIPILWNLEGLYGWIPIEIVRNEAQAYESRQKLKEGVDYGTTSFDSLKFNWQQTYRLRQDVGRILEELANA